MLYKGIQHLAKSDQEHQTVIEEDLKMITCGVIYSKT